MPEVLYEEVIEVDERVVLKQDGCLLPRKDRKRVVTGVQMISPHTLLECFVLGFFGASSKYNQWGITLFALRPIQEYHRFFLFACRSSKWCHIDNACIGIKHSLVFIGVCTDAYVTHECA